MTVPAALDRRFRDAAVSERLLDVAYEIVDSPIGPLLVAATEQGVCRITFDGEEAADAELESLSRQFGARVLRSGRPVAAAARELDEYFNRRRRAFDIELDLRLVAGFSRQVLTQLAAVPYGEVTTYGALAARAGNPRAARAVGTVMNRNPLPIVLPCHRVIGSTGKLVGYGGGLHRKVALLELEAATL